MVTEQDKMKLSKLYAEESETNEYDELMNVNQMNDETIMEETERLEKRKKIREELKKETVNKYKLRELWKEVFGYYVYEQPTYANFYFHYIMGGLFFHDVKIIRGENEEDIRTSLILMGPTGIGKSESNNFVSSVVVKIPKKRYYNSTLGEIIEEKFVCKPLGKTTDTGMIGTMNGELDFQQRKSGIFPMRTFKDGRVEADSRYKNPIIPGVLLTADFIIVDEAEKIFRPNKHSEEIHQILRNATNRYGSSGNWLSNDSAMCEGRVGGFSSSSLCMTSYQMDSFNRTFHEGGLLQRMLLYIDFENKKKRKKIRNMLINDCVTEKKEEDIVRNEIKKQKMSKLITELIELKEKFMINKAETWKPEERKPIVLPKNVGEQVDGYVSSLLQDTSMTISQKEIYESTELRLAMMILRLATHNAISEGRLILNETDVKLAYEDVILQQSDCVAEFLRQTVTDTRKDDEYRKQRNYCINALKQYPKGIQKTELRKLLKNKINVTWSKIDLLLETFEEEKLFEIRPGAGAEKICFLVGPHKASWEREDVIESD